MTAGPILEFKGEHRFLSNFAPSPIKVPPMPAINGEPRMHPASGWEAPTVEHAFQVLKCVDEVQARTVLEAPSPQEARARGKRVTLRPDWEDVKRDVMLVLLRRKFREPYDEPGRSALGLTERLLATGYRMLVEGNTWGDWTWGATWTTRGQARLDGFGAAAKVWASEPLHGEPGPTQRVLAGENWLGRLLMLVRAELDCAS
jgi:predicted NAD-dependent protein-ADP-ribosyltransferase YbiA (DUF1768 family)